MYKNLFSARSMMSKMMPVLAIAACSLGSSQIVFGDDVPINDEKGTVDYTFYHEKDKTETWLHPFYKWGYTYHDKEFKQESGRRTSDYTEDIEVTLEWVSGNMYHGISDFYCYGTIDTENHYLDWLGNETTETNTEMPCDLRGVDVTVWRYEDKWVIKRIIFELSTLEPLDTHEVVIEGNGQTESIFYADYYEPTPEDFENIPCASDCVRDIELFRDVYEYTDSNFAKRETWESYTEGLFHPYSSLPNDYRGLVYEIDEMETVSYCP